MLGRDRGTSFTKLVGKVSPELGMLYNATIICACLVSMVRAFPFIQAVVNADCSLYHVEDCFRSLIQASNVILDDVLEPVVELCSPISQTV